MRTCVCGASRGSGPQQRPVPAQGSRAVPAAAEPRTPGRAAGGRPASPGGPPDALGGAGQLQGQRGGRQDPGHGALAGGDAGAGGGPAAGAGEQSVGPRAHRVPRR